MLEKNANLTHLLSGATKSSWREHNTHQNSIQGMQKRSNENANIGTRTSPIRTQSKYTQRLHGLHWPGKQELSLCSKLKSTFRKPLRALENASTKVRVESVWLLMGSCSITCPVQPDLASLVSVWRFLVWSAPEGALQGDSQRQPGLYCGITTFETWCRHC